MNREEAIAVFEEIKVNYETDSDWGVYDGVFSRRNLTEILDAYATLLCPKPDPDTGLVPCGCGGKARLYELNDDFYLVRVECSQCYVATRATYNEERATHDWNTAMGWEG